MIDTGISGGIRAGYDYQCNNLLFGAIVDWDATTLGKTMREDPNDDEDENLLKNEKSWYTTIRLRAGGSVCDTYLYITGGAVAARFKTTWQDAPEVFDVSDIRWGWVGGFGAEHVFCKNWSVGSEILSMNFSNKNHSFAGADSTFDFGHSDSAIVGRIFITYRFSDLFSCCR